MAGTTEHFGLELLDPSQEQPEVPLNFDLIRIDELLFEAAGTISVKQAGDSPAGNVSAVRTIKFVNATVERETGDVAVVTIEESSGSGGSPLEVTDGVTDVADVTTLRFSGATVTEESSGVAHVAIDGTSGGGIPVVLQLACSDLTTALATGASVAYVRAPQGFTLDTVRSSLLVNSSSGLVTVDIKKNGTTVLSTALSIDATEFTSVTAATPAVISDDSIGDDDLLTIDITAAGTGAKGLIVSLIGAA